MLPWGSAERLSRSAHFIMGLRRACDCRKTHGLGRHKAVAKPETVVEFMVKSSQSLKLWGARSLRFSAHFIMGVHKA